MDNSVYSGFKCGRVLQLYSKLLTEAAKALSEQQGLLIGKPDTDITIGSIYGFPLSIRQHSFADEVTATLKGAASYFVQLGSSSSYNIKRLENTVGGLNTLLDEAVQKRARLVVEHDDANAALNQPFPQLKELETKSARLAVLNDELNEAAQQATAAKGECPRTYYFNRDQRKKMGGITCAVDKPKEKTKFADKLSVGE